MSESMETDLLVESNGKSTVTKENGLHIYPVAPNQSGVGLPYAPEDFPNPGDNWRWKVGQRIGVCGYYRDRYLYLPTRLQKEHKSGGYPSKLAVQRFVKEAFPDTDATAFFSTFSWKVPSIKVEDEIDVPTPVPRIDLKIGIDCCKAGNCSCISLAEPENPSPSDVSPCHYCCSEPDFCRQCCCILCSRSMQEASSRYDFIKCDAIVGEGLICGHGVHIECGLRSYMAGTVGGSINLDAQYYCRRCNNKIDLVPHVMNLFQTCQSIDSQDDIEKVLNICVSALRGSNRTKAIMLLDHIGLAATKLRSGISREDIWKMEDLSAITSDLYRQLDRERHELSEH